MCRVQTHKFLRFLLLFANMSATNRHYGAYDYYAGKNSGILSEQRDTSWYGHRNCPGNLNYSHDKTSYLLLELRDGKCRSDANLVFFVGANRSQGYPPRHFLSIVRIPVHSDYLNPAMRQLRDQMVKYAPRDRKIAQVDRAERLISELDQQKNYPYEYLCFRVTDFRPGLYPDLRLTGAEASHDLRLFVEDVSDAVGLPAENAGERVLTLDELSKEFNVSTKTISRWREHGLIARRFVFDGRKRLGFLRSSVDRFVSNNRQRVKRGEKFRQLSDEEKYRIIERARRLAKAGGTPAEVIQRVAKAMERSVETVRYTIKAFDKKNPDLAVFPDATAPLSDEVRQRIFVQHQMGSTIETLARRYRRTRSSIYRILGETRARLILDLPLDYIDSDEFHENAAEKAILAPVPKAEEAAKKSRLPAGLPPYLASLYEVPLLNREQEAHLFRKMNYLKFRAAELREGLDPNAPKASLMDKIESVYADAQLVKNQIVRANLRLVVSIAKRHVNSTDNFFELVSDGNISLMRAVEKFDYSRGNKFSTYASWAIMKNFARTIPGETRHRDRFRTATYELFEGKEETRANPYMMETEQRKRESAVGKILSRLDEREQQIIISRFGLGRDIEPMTLKQVGEDMGVTKERVRQIEARALNKLRVAAHEERLEVPD